MQVRQHVNSQAGCAPARLLFLCLTVFTGILCPAAPEPFERYQPIIKRAPFGPLLREPTEAELAAALAQAALNQPVPPVERLADTVRLSAMSKYNGIPAAGFVDKRTNKSFLLLEGQTLGDYTLEAVCFEASSALLSKGDVTEEISLSFASGQPTNIVGIADSPYLTGLNLPIGLHAAAVASMAGSTPPQTAESNAPPKTVPDAVAFSPEMIAAATTSDGTGGTRISFRELHRLRVQELREKAEAESARREVLVRAEIEQAEAQKTKEAQEAEIMEKARVAAEKLHRAKVIQAIKDGYDVQLDFELTAAEAKSLAAAGFEIPEEATAAEPENAAENAK
jgi:hypothetical protein